MRIAQLAPLTESVPPKTYGGTELIVSLLTEGLIGAGHEVTLFASGDSETAAKLVSVAPKALRLDESVPMRRWSAYSLLQLNEFENRQDDFDVIHNHMGYEAFALLTRSKLPSVTTNHNPIKDYCAPLFLSNADLSYVSISNAYRRLNYPDKLNYAATIYNGIDIAPHLKPIDSEVPDRKYLLFLGRVCVDKGTEVAIDIARKIGLPLKIAGKVDEADRHYFETLIKPKLDPPDVEYIGEVNFAQKLRLYAGAIAVVYPIAFDEPFGLVMAEAMASGTPILGFDRGSVSELVRDGETGILGKTADELVKRFDEIGKISNEKCRERARDNFSKERMVSEYIKLYESLC